MKFDSKPRVADKGASNIADILVEPANNSAIEQKDIPVGEISGVPVVVDVKDNRSIIPEYFAPRYNVNQ